MRTRLLCLVLSVPVALGAVFATPAPAQSVTRAVAVAEDNSEQRINYSGKLRMLSQRIPAAACHLMRGIDVQGSAALLTAAPAEFEKILTALEFGDADLNIMHPEQGRKALWRIHTLRDRWEPMKAAADAVAVGTATEEELHYILEENMSVLLAAMDLVSQLVKQYSNPNAVPFSELLLVDISGRQRMLTQKMSKESCISATAFATDTTLSDLQGTMQIFETSLNALRFGMSDVGIKEPPNSAIAEGLDVVNADWMSVKPLLLDVLDGKPLETDDDVKKFQRLNTTMADMNRVVGLYAASAKPSF